jgi:hypothetical protein
VRTIQNSRCIAYYVLKKEEQRQQHKKLALSLKKKKKQEETGTIDAQQIYTDGNISGDISNNEI